MRKASKHFRKTSLVHRTAVRTSRRHEKDNIRIMSQQQHVRVAGPSRMHVGASFISEERLFHNYLSSFIESSHSMTSTTNERSLMLLHPMNDIRIV